MPTERLGTTLSRSKKIKLGSRKKIVRIKRDPTNSIAKGEYEKVRVAHVMLKRRTERELVAKAGSEVRAK
jgi:hypothetical protein